MVYPDGYEDNLITFTNAEGRYISALPFETEEIYYLIRMTAGEARQIVKDDDDFDSEGSREERALGYPVSPGNSLTAIS